MSQGWEPATIANDDARAVQARVVEWVRRALGDDELHNTPVRTLRFAEEAIELAQACGVDAVALHKLVDYVFSRPVGEPTKELGGCLVTLCTVAETLEVSLFTEFEKELARIQAPEVIERVRRRQSEKREVTAAALPIDCPCADWTMVDYPREAYGPSWLDGSARVREHHPGCPQNPRNGGPRPW